MVFMKNSIKLRLFISFFTLIFLIVILMGFVLYNISNSIVKNELGHARVEVLKQTVNNIDIIINEIYSVSNLYYFDQDLIEILSSKRTDDKYQEKIKNDKLLEIFNKYIYAFDSLNLKYYAVLYGFNGRYYTSWINNSYNFETLPEREWYDDIINANGKMIWVNTFLDDTGREKKQFVFSGARLIKNQYNGQNLGILLLNINEEVLHKSYSNLETNNNHVFIIDNKGNYISDGNKEILAQKNNNNYIKDILSNTNSEGFFVTKIKGKLNLISYYYIDNVDWFIVEETPLNIVLKPMEVVRNLTYLILIIFLIIAFIMAYIIAKRISNPIRQLYIHMEKQIRDNQLKEMPNIKGSMEVLELRLSFNKLINNINNLMNNIKKNEELKRKAEYQFLQAQVNPHFLYNTLGSIRCMIEMNKKNQASKMLIALVRLLRNSLSNENTMITIEEEISNIKDYIIIQKNRYENKFKVHYDIDQTIADCKMLKMTLQPIVENAIFHGLEPKKDKGNIFIRITKKEEDLLIVIEDDGVGISEEKMNIIIDEINDEIYSKFNGIGLKNVHDRIVINFGEKYGITVSSNENGTKVKIIIPLIN